MESNAGMILVMGETGVGKSTFINALRPDSVSVGHSLKSTLMPKGPQAIQVYLDEKGKNSVTVVDTPGFDDSHRPDSDVLSEITEFLAAQYAGNIPLKGVVYLHKIQDNKMRGSARRYLEVFRSLCGEQALANVVLVTTFWNNVPEEKLGEHLRREQELIDDYWAPMQRKGSVVTQFDGSKEAAESLVLQLAQNPRSVVLDIQRELVDDEKVISETRGGMAINEQLVTDLKRWTQDLRKIESSLARAEGEKDVARVKELKEEKKHAEKIVKVLEKSQKRMQSRVGSEMKYRFDKERSKRILATSVSIFATVLSITLTVVKFVGLGGM